MEDLILNSRQMTMTSLEIAELVGSRHDNVKRTIERLWNEAIIVQPPMEDGHSTDAMGRDRTISIYVFSGEQGKRDSIIVVAQLCPEFTARLVDRWTELERQVSGGALSIPDFSDPAAAARAWADQYERSKSLEAENRKMLPRVEFANAVGRSETQLNATQVASTLGIRSAISLNRRLDAIGGVYNQVSKRGRVFCAQWIAQGYGKNVTDEDGHSYPVFFSKALEAIRSILSENQMYPEQAA